MHVVKNVTGAERNLSAASVICWSDEIQTQRLLSFADDGFGKITLHVYPLWRVEDYKTSRREGRGKNWNRGRVFRLKKKIVSAGRGKEGMLSTQQEKEQEYMYAKMKKAKHAALVSSTTTSITIHCGPSQLILQMWKLLTTTEVPVCGSYWCICRRCWASFSSFPVYSKPTESFVTYFPAKT